MRKEYKISLFFMILLVAVLSLVLVWRRQMLNSAQNKNNDIELQNVPIDTKEMPYNELDEITQVQRVDDITTSDTICIYENIDKKDGSTSIEEQKLPPKYIGLKREALEKALEEDCKALTLEDKEKGFQSQHLELFSSDRIKILRIYDTTKELTGYYIMALNGEICVYKNDKKTLYFKTGLRVEDLPPTVRAEVQEGKYMDNELQVYHFIESYSS